MWSSIKDWLRGWLTDQIDWEFAYWNMVSIVEDQEIEINELKEQIEELRSDKKTA